MSGRGRFIVFDMRGTRTPRMVVNSWTWDLYGGRGVLLKIVKRSVKKKCKKEGRVIKLMQR